MENTEETPKKEQKKTDDNIIFVGSKPLVNYVRGVLTQFQKNNADEVIIKSRGKFISKAVDIAEIAKRTLAEQKIQVTGISIASESFQINDKKTNISTMDITLAKS
jgi:DNA-binding protein